MLLDKYVNKNDKGFSFSRWQASEFAKRVATDFNPIHDEDAKRFCVPGDLLFAYLLTHYGISSQLTCHFAGMVNADVVLHCKEQPEQLTICDAQDKVFLTLQRQGKVANDPAVVEPLIRDYVQFSGQNFPHILQPLMKQHQVMINPQRPLVIYESMSLSFSELPKTTVQLKLTSTALSVEGKRGSALLKFALLSSGEEIGKGEKRMILSNLMPYNEEQMQNMVDEYNQRKETV